MKDNLSPTHHLNLYPEDFVDDIWNQVCDVCGVSPAVTSITIPFRQDAVDASMPEDDEELEELE